MSTFAAVPTSQAPAYSSRAYAYHAARLYTSYPVGSSSAASAPVAAPSRFADLSLLRASLPQASSPTSAAFPMLSIGTPGGAYSSPPSTPPFFPSLLAAQRSAHLPSPSASLFAKAPGALHPLSPSAPASRLARPDPTPLCRPAGRSSTSSSSSGGYPSPCSSSHHSAAAWSSTSSLLGMSSSSSARSIPTPHPRPLAPVWAPPPVAFDLDLELDDEDEEERAFRLSVQMDDGDFDGDNEGDGGGFGDDDVGMMEVALDMEM
ncbi:hypothetical protein JCM21900_005109 [Sporobolomyces salmonicolor]